MIDLDVIAAALDRNFRPWQETNFDLLRRALKMRNLLLLRLAKPREGNAWFIIGAPSKLERDWWQLRLGGEVVLLNPGAEECKRRALERGTPNAVQGIDDWYERSGHGWSPPSSYSAVDEDGWPLDE